MADPAGGAEAGHHEHALDQRPGAEAGVGAVRLAGDQRHDGQGHVLDEHLIMAGLKLCDLFDCWSSGLSSWMNPFI